MPSDRKRRGKRPSKRKFQGNRFTKQPRIDGDDEVVISGDESEREHLQTACSDQSPSGSAASATPTRTERKLMNLYDLSVDSSDESSSAESESDASSGESDHESDVEDTFIQDLGGYRLIDVDILNRNVMSQVACRYCGSDIKLYEIERKGLGSKFAFMCQNNRQTRSHASGYETFCGSVFSNFLCRQRHTEDYNSPETGSDGHQGVQEEEETEEAWQR